MPEHVAQRRAALVINRITPRDVVECLANGFSDFCAPRFTGFSSAGFSLSAEF